MKTKEYFVAVIYISDILKIYVFFKFFWYVFSYVHMIKLFFKNKDMGNSKFSIVVSLGGEGQEDRRGDHH